MNEEQLYFTNLITTSSTNILGILNKMFIMPFVSLLSMVSIIFCILARSD